MWAPFSRIQLRGSIDRAQSAPSSRRLKMSLDVRNLLRGYRHIARPDGSEPPGYSRDEGDPLGRTVRLTLRKQF
jgi:hypothetical protein